MANWDVCYNWMMDNEDSAQGYKSEPDSVPVRPTDSPEAIAYKENARAISGINSYYFPDQFNAIAKVVGSARALGVENFYDTNFWNRWYAQIIDDEKAKRIFDSAVNQGSGTAVEIAQETINSMIGDKIEVDGHFGPQTLAAINSKDLALFVSAFKTQRCIQYLKHPSPLVGTMEKPGPLLLRAMK